ncbi:DUF1801 domain-containing protein [Mucilaginibacter sp. E4BP6]|uniref:DUF1801 domain-containing protein n=1 Tax=Mucilaginibacter sp. E4BP6 TaxID=2723089 RepID=UPI0015CD11E2|nr:DUF1801 domain-containing protein [Mucilaginibacter sp. E4BP6]NYE66798.1 hypothetical protein [Mucilaginibacter sp. E4BP6]
MTEVKTKPTEISADSFIATIEDDKVRADCYTIINLMENITGEKPKMWGPAIIGFGKYTYKYESGRSGEICITGFSPREANITLYVLAGFPGQEELLQKLGKHKSGKGCLYIKKLDDVKVDVLEILIKESFKFLKEKHHTQLKIVD